MNRERQLNAFARKHKMDFVVDRESGKGSHYLVKLGNRSTTVQKDLNPHRIKRILKQLELRQEEL